MDKKSVLKEITFGQRVAEEEAELLREYFVETDQWERLYRGDIDIVYGPKGAGKSALYALLVSRADRLLKRSILIIGAENPRGTPAFSDLALDPPTTEREFIGLWKLYFASLVHDCLVERNIDNSAVNKLGDALQSEGLTKGSSSLQSLLRGIANYARKWFRPQSVEGGIDLDPNTQMPSGFTGKIIFREPDRDAAESGFVSVDNLLTLANEALKPFQVWILMDRLDVAFLEDHQLESNALRALFRVYNDMAAFSAVQLKIFLRSDIWEKITNTGFREASHITRHVTLKWDRASLLNLVVRRAVHNPVLRDVYGMKVEISQQPTTDQELFFYRVFPKQVDAGSKKPSTFDWLLSRTQDGQKVNTPREVIHFLNALREVQMKRLEVGELETEGEQLFARAAFKAALPEVSKVRLEQGIYAEHPEAKGKIEKLRGGRTSYTAAGLAKVWNVKPNEAMEVAEELESIGFFELRKDKNEPEYWVPFLYRDALALVQGKAM